MRSPTVTPKLQRLAAQAAHEPKRGLTTRAHRIDEDWLREAYCQTNKSRVAGMDGGPATRYAEPLDDNRRDLDERLRSGGSQAAPGERVGIETEDGGQGPLGTPAFEDKIVQRAGARLLEAMYAQDLPACANGVRPGRSPQAALHVGRARGRQAGIGWLVAADVRGDFDSSDRTRLREGRRQRGKAGRIVGRMGKWLRAGVMEDGGLHHPETGVGQGGVLSPVLANVVLPHVWDGWCARDVRPRLKGRGLLRRFAEDCGLGGEREADARKIMAVRPKRCAGFGLAIQPEQTALLAFRQPEGRQAAEKGNGTGDFVGLPHYWTRSRRGFWGLKRSTARKRLRRPKQALWHWGRTNRHAPVQYQ